MVQYYHKVRVVLVELGDDDEFHDVSEEREVTGPSNKNYHKNIKNSRDHVDHGPVPTASWGSHLQRLSGIQVKIEYLNFSTKNKKVIL